MTKFELAQPREVFIHAGRTAQYLGVNRMDNPYPKEAHPESRSGETYAALWDRGFSSAFPKIPFKGERIRKDDKKRTHVRKPSPRHHQPFSVLRDHQKAGR